MKEGHSQEAALRWILFILLFTPCHPFSCALISLSGWWQLLPCVYLPLCQQARILPTNIHDCLSHQLRQANLTAARLLGIYWQLRGWIHLSNSRMCHCLIVAPPPSFYTSLLNHSAKPWWQNAGDCSVVVHLAHCPELLDNVPAAWSSTNLLKCQTN